MVRTIAEIEDLVKNNPFDGQFESDKDLHVFFLSDELSGDQEELLMEKSVENEQFAIRGRSIFCCLKISILDSAVGKGFIDKKLKVPATARNWRTVKAIASM